MTDSDRVPPVEMVAHCEEINKQWLKSTDVECEPYLSRGDWDEWKIRLVKRHTRAIVMEYITMEGAYGHTLYLFVNQLKQQYYAGIEEGQKMAIARMTNATCEQVGVKIHDFKQYYNPPPPSAKGPNG